MRDARSRSRAVRRESSASRPARRKCCSPPARAIASSPPSNSPTNPRRRGKSRASATPTSIDMERLVALRPDVVVVWEGGGNVAQVEKLEQIAHAALSAQGRRHSRTCRLRCAGSAQLTGTREHGRTPRGGHRGASRDVCTQRFGSGEPLTRAARSVESADLHRGRLRT